MKYFLMSLATLSLVACDRNDRPKEEKEVRIAIPADQAETESDRDLNRRIRAVIIEDKNLSDDARNIIIITRNGIITLKGPVLNEAEKENIARKVRAFIGSQQIDNQLKPKQ